MTITRRFRAIDVRGFHSLQIQVFLALLILSVFACPSFAETEITFPLRGVFRPGKYMPVRVLTTDSSPVTISAAGAVSTVLRDPSPGVRTIVPMLPVRSQLGTIGTSAVTRPADQAPVPFRALAPTERLVGIAGGATSDFAQRVIFPGLQVIAIELDAADPLPGPLAAWESLDAVVLDQFPDPAIVAGLLAADTTIAVNTSAAPTDQLPWERIEDFWVLGRRVYGPTGVLASEGYNPAIAWNPGHPWVDRRQLLLMMSAFCIVVLAAALSRSRWVTIGCIGVAVFGSIGIVAWRSAQSPMVEANGAVLIASDSFTQRDDWIFRRSLEQNAKASIAISGLVKLILDDARQIEQSRLQLEVSPADRNVLKFTYELSPQQILAFVARRVTPGRWPGDPVRPARTPLASLRDLYLDPSTELRGHIPDPLPNDETPPANVTRWPALYIDRLKTPPGQRTLAP